MCKYANIGGVFQRSGSRLQRGGLVLTLELPPFTIQPNHKAKWFLHEFREGSRSFVSSVWKDSTQRLFFLVGKIRFNLKLEDSRAIIEPEAAVRSVPFVYHRDFVRFKRTEKRLFVRFQGLKKFGK